MSAASSASLAASLAMGYGVSSSGLVGLAWQSYLQQLRKRPLATKATTAAGIAALSSVIAQKIVTPGGLRHDKMAKVALYGLLWSGPSAHLWHTFLDWLFSGRNDLQTAVSKVAIDQLTYGPLCNVLL